MLDTLSAAMTIAAKIEKLASLLELIHWDEETKTLTIDSSITVKIKGDHKIETERHLILNSNYLVMDEEAGIPFSVLLNTDEKDLKTVKANIDKIVSEANSNNGDCGCH